jgi:hypothetical protein
MNNPIFPSEPATVNLHPVPTQAEFISYFVSRDTLTIRAWMPDNLSSFVESSSTSREQDRFFDNNCGDCPRNTRWYYEQNHPELFDQNLNWIDANINRFIRDNPGECVVYIDGYQGQNCPLGITFEPKLEPTHSISNMVFDIELSCKGEPPRFKKYTDNAHLRAGYVDESGEIYETTAFAASNVYTSSYSYDSGYTHGKICWNSIQDHKSLREIVTSYFGSNFNNDLLTLSRFKNNINTLRSDKENDRYTKSKHKFLCSGYDCLILIDADNDVQAFFTMLMAGFKSLPELPHIMIVPAKTSTIKRGDMIYLGYTTQEDSVGRPWYISTEGALIGQLDESFVTV